MKYFRIVFIILISLLLLSCRGGEKEKKEVTILLPNSISALPVLECRNCIIEGFIVETGFYTDPILSMAEIITGKKDIIMTGFTHGCAQYNARQDVVHIVTLVWGVASLIAYGIDINDMKDLKGKKILVPFPKSPLDLQLRAILKKEKMGGNTGIGYAPVQQAVPLLLNRQADAVCIPEPLASKLVYEQNMTRMFSFSNKWEELFGYKHTPQVSLFAKKEFVNKNRKFLKALIHTFERHITRLASLSEKKMAEYSSMFSIEQKVFQKAMDNTIFSVLQFHHAFSRSKEYINDIDSNIMVNDDFFFSYNE